MSNKTFPTQEEAQSFVALLGQGVRIDPTAAKAPFWELAEQWRESQPPKAESTRRRDEALLDNHILPVFGDRPIGRIAPSEIQRWVNTLDRSPDTTAKAKRILSAVLEIARRDRAIPVNPAAEVTIPRPATTRTARALSDSEVEALIFAAEDHDPATAPIVWLMARCGLRIGEVLALKRTDLDIKGGALTVERSLSRHEGIRPLKSRTIGESRVIPLPADVIGRMATHPVALHGGGWLFPSDRGTPMSDPNWRKRVWVKVKKAAGVECRPHDLRHTVATRLFKVGRWTPGEVQVYLGHKDPRITLEIYTHIANSDLPEPPPLDLSLLAV